MKLKKVKYISMKILVIFGTPIIVFHIIPITESSVKEVIKFGIGTVATVLAILWTDPIIKKLSEK